jgi:N-acetylneuraminic acid mutarotase
MFPQNSLRDGLTVTALVSTVIICSVGIFSCKKATAPLPGDALGNPGGKTATSLTVGGPPTIVWWGNGTTIPYTDDIPGDIPKANQYGQGFTINGKGYVCGSLLETGVGTGDHINELWQFDPATLAWTKKAPFPGGELIEAANFVIGDNAYIVTGNATYQYNQPTDTWTQKAYIFSVQRMLATAFAINGKGYIGLGYDPNSTNLDEQNDWWQYDPATDRWIQKAAFPGGKRDGAGGFSVDGKGYVVSGEHSTVHYVNGHFEGQVTWGNKVWQYDPVADSWAQKADFPGPGRWEAVSANATVGGTDVGFIVGGDNDGNAFNDAWEYNPATDTWGQLPNILGGARTESGGFVIGRSLYITNKTVVVLNWSN